VIHVAGWFFENNKSCALKSNFGESGWGTLFIKYNDFKNEEEIIDHIKKEFENDSIWANNLILVEEYIKPNQNNLSGSPSSELFLSSKGVQITYLCDQVLGETGDFLGVAIGKGVLDRKIISEIEIISLAIGKRFWNLGYRGFFDIDFILSDENILYIIETNMRRTGGTHVYDVANSICGKNWKENYFIISQDQFCYGDKGKRKKEIVEKIQEVMYPIKGKAEGVIISILNKKKSTLGFIIIGDSKKKCINFYNKMLNVINNN